MLSAPRGSRWRMKRTGVLGTIMPGLRVQVTKFTGCCASLLFIAASSPANPPPGQPQRQVGGAGRRSIVVNLIHDDSRAPSTLLGWLVVGLGSPRGGRGGMTGRPRGGWVGGVGFDTVRVSALTARQILIDNGSHEQLEACPDIRSGDHRDSDGRKRVQRTTRNAGRQAPSARCFLPTAVRVRTSGRRSGHSVISDPAGRRTARSGTGAGTHPQNLDRRSGGLPVRLPGSGRQRHRGARPRARLRRRATRGLGLNALA